MFEDLDEVLRQLLIRELPIRDGEIDVTFDQPRREWSARLSRPTLNLFLHDVRENVQLRGSQQWRTWQNNDGTVIQRRTPVRVDVHYMITAWAKDPADEHSLLARALVVLIRQPGLPADLLTEVLKVQPAPMILQVAQPGPLQRPGEIWNSLDNEMRPAVVLVVTMTIDPYEPIVTPVVRTRAVRSGQASNLPDQQTLTAEADQRWSVGGRLHSTKGLDKVRVLLLERGVEVEVGPDGRFSISQLAGGQYTLEVSLDGKGPQRFTITVPAPDYELELE